MTAIATKPFILTRVFDAPRDIVFKAWTDPDQLNKWFGPKDFPLSFSKMSQLQPGGTFHYTMDLPNGSKMWGKWTFVEIEPPERLVTIVSFSDENGGVTRHPFSPTWPLKTLSTAVFTEQGNKTLLTLQWEALEPTEEERKTFDEGHASMSQGWGGTMDQLDTYLKNLQGN